VALGDVLQKATGKADGWNAVGQKMSNISLELVASLEWLNKSLTQTVAEYDMLESHINAVGDRIDAKYGFTQSQRANASARLAADIHESQHAEYAWHHAQTEYEQTANELAAALDGGMTKPDTEHEQKKKTGVHLKDQSEDGDGKTKTTPSTNSITEAATALAQAEAAARLSAEKSADELELAQMEASHKLFQTSDEDYYRDRLAVQKLELNQEADAMRAHIALLQAQEKTQHADPKLNRDASGNSAEELKTQKEILDLQAKIAALEEKKAALDINAKLTATERADAVHLASLKVAAQLEEQTNGGIQARLALMLEEQRIAMDKSTAEGGDTAGLAALQQQEQELLKINQIEREINAVKAEGALKVGAQKDREEKDPTQRKAATKEINAINKETAATLKELTAQYDALAATLGGDFIEKAKVLHAELDKLNTPDQKMDQLPYKNLAEGMTSMGDQMAQATGKGREGFHSMVQSMEQDLVELAAKFAIQKWLTPFLNGMFSGGGGSSGMDAGAGADGSFYEGGGGIPGHANGGDYDGDSPMIVGENGPELAFPKGPGTIMPDPELFFPKNAAAPNPTPPELYFPKADAPTVPSGASELSRAASSGPPSVTMNITNASSQPVTARTTGTSFDSDMKAFVIHTILEDHASGGPISAASQGG
jgi:hypothetical protein